MTTKKFTTKWEFSPDEFWEHLQNEDDARLLFADLGLTDTIEMVGELKQLFIDDDTAAGYRKAAYLTKMQTAFQNVMDEYLNENKGYDKTNYATV